MEVKFQCSGDEDINLILEQVNKDLLITNTCKRVDDGNIRITSVAVLLNKSQLSDFIGQLLHIQSKLNRR